MAPDNEPTKTITEPPNTAAAAAAASEIARAVQRRFAALPGNGKPASHEHTVLAGFVVSCNAAENQPREYCVASLATGTKCLGAGRRREAAEARASLLHDSHAEALARRGLLLWVHGQLRRALQFVEEEEQQRERSGQGDLASPAAAAASTPPNATTTTTQIPPLCFRWLPDRRRFALLPGVELYLYVSQPPCGDASILHDSDEDDGGDDGGEALPELEPPQAGLLPAGRTGAKLIEPAMVAADDATAPAAPIVPQAGHVEAVARPQRKGALRRKPGKGDATLSMSCSDKLARWHALGLQGALLSSVLEAPLRLSGVVVSVPPLPTASGNSGQGDDAAAAAARDVELAARRAVFDRFEAAIEDAADALRGDGGAAAAAAEQHLRSALICCRGRGDQATAMAAPPPPAALGLAPTESRRVPCGVAINWHYADGPAANKAEVTVGASGCRAGAGGGRAGRDSPATRSRLSRASMAGRFVELLEAIEGRLANAGQGHETPPPRLSPAEARLLPLAELKRRAAPAYTRAWAALLDVSRCCRQQQQQQQPNFAGAWLRKPEDGLAVADYPMPLGAAGRAGRADAAAAGRGGRAGEGGGEDGAEPAKRMRTTGAAPSNTPH